jgi:hypothetical protein
LAQSRAKDIDEKEEAGRYRKAPQPVYDHRKEAAMPEDGRTGPAETVLNLQQTYGNRYVQRLVESTKVQAKLTVSSPDDEYEREADKVADAVTRASAPSIQRQAEEEEEIQAKPIAEQITPLVQRQEEEPEEEEEPIQTKLANNIQVQRQTEEPEEEAEEEGSIQTEKAGGQTPLIGSSLESRINSLKGGGQPLPKSVRNYFEPRFGYDFSRVRIHTNERANYLARSINAKAFTFGQDMFFNTGQYLPSTIAGKHLLAHELTHVVHQSSKQPTTALGDKSVVIQRQVGTKAPRKTCNYTITYANLRTVGCGGTNCGAAIRYDITKVTATGSGCPSTLKGLRLTESATTDSGCVPGAVQTRPGCLIGAGGTVVSPCTDTYWLCMPASTYPAVGCIEIYTQKVYVGGVLAETHYIIFRINRSGKSCSGTVTRV